MLYTRKFTLSSLLKYPSCDNCDKQTNFFSCAQEIFLVCTPVKNGEWRALMAGKYYEMICDFHVVFWYEIK